MSISKENKQFKIPTDAEYLAGLDRDAAEMLGKISKALPISQQLKMLGDIFMGYYLHEDNQEEIHEHERHVGIVLWNNLSQMLISSEYFVGEREEFITRKNLKV